MGSLYDAVFAKSVELVEKNVVPDFIVRRGIRYLLAKRLEECSHGGDVDKQIAAKQEFVEELKSLPVAINTADANEQHYELPTEYFLAVLGPQLKYSSGYYPGLDPSTQLDIAEEAMLQMCCDRAELKNGMDILELGCGWGSLTLFMAESFPSATITAVSNSRTQREFIEGRAIERGLTNVKIITDDVTHFEPPASDGGYDRVVSVEMFEHMKNYRELLGRISKWLRPGGKLFVHMFTHKDFNYHFEDNGPDDWMTRYFFSGGTMASHDLLLHFQQHLTCAKHWRVNGRHYAWTLEDWLRRQDQVQSSVLDIFAKTYGEENALKWMVRWRLFYMACAELFKYDNGNQWGVSHYLFENIPRAAEKAAEASARRAATRNPAARGGRRTSTGGGSERVVL
ncbi:unnamed protein product [Pedinophyceae sp. YPF-701]|nr:unnamed protein product [Pedinophyceae sp. YPF-701]